MAIYVDALSKNTPAKRNWRYAHFSRLFADELDELIDFADLIGLKRASLIWKGGIPHYDLNSSRRALVVLNGALELPRNEEQQLIIRLTEHYSTAYSERNKASKK